MTFHQRRRVIIVYNADGSVTGKLRYAYKKLFHGTEKGSPVCGNCDITHGGLSLTETAAWTSSKEKLQSSLDVIIAQLHRDELDERLHAFVKQNSTRLPTVLFDDGKSVQELVSRDQINVCARGMQDQKNSIDEQRATLLIDSIKESLQKQDSGSKL